MADAKRVQVGGLEMAWSEAGQASAGPRPFVLVHGFTGDRSDWDEVRAPLAELGRTITPDLRGHGETGGSGRPEDYTFPHLVADLSGFLDALGVERCDLLGHSMGGMVALRLALSEPQRVASLVLMDTAPAPMPIPERIQHAAVDTARNAGMAAIYALLHAMRGADDRAPSSLALETHVGEEAFWSRVRRKVEAMDPEAFATLYPLLAAHEAVTGRLGELRMPTTVLVGAEDAPFREPAETMAAAIPDARLVVIEKAGHSPQLEHPAAWLEAVRGHLARARAT